MAVLVGCSSSQPTGGHAKGAAPAGSLGLNDVSVLLPLPKTLQEADLLIKPSDVGSKGPMLPDWVAPGPALVQSEDRATTLANLRVVATRLDPCWPSIAEADPTKCQRVLHVVWQPIVPAWESGATTMAGADAAVHTFHRLTDGEFDALLVDLVALTASAPLDPRTPLQVHPTVASQGLSGAYFARHKALIEKYAGADNVFEMTFLALRANVTSNPYLGQGWLLSGMNFGSGEESRVSVATTSDNEEHFGNNVSGSIEDAASFLGDFTPASTNTTTLLNIVGDTTKAQTAPISDIQAAVDVALEAENPMRNTLDSVECLTCHVATSARTWAEKNRGIDTSTNPLRYTSANFDLTLTSDSATRTDAIHGLGYYGVHSSIAQRTVNDTAAAADFINAILLRGETADAGSDAGDGATDNAPPTLGYTEAMPIAAPAGATLGAIAIDANTAALYVASGGAILRGDAKAGGMLTAFADLSSAGFSTVSTLRVATSGDLVAASADRAVHVTAAGHVGVPTLLLVPFATAAFGGASVAISPDGASLFVVEGGSGSPGSAGSNVVHVARFALQPEEASASPESAADVFELGSPFEIVPSTTANINADAPFVSQDGTLLYVPHVVLRHVFAVAVSAPHTVSVLDTDSLDRSATATSLDPNGLLVEAAAFDQTVPVFRMKSDGAASFVVEIPVGLSPGSVASYEDRVFVVMGSGLGSGPPSFGDGGPAFGDAGFIFGDGGFAGGLGGGPGQGGDAAAGSIRVFELKR